MKSARHQVVRNATLTAVQVVVTAVSMFAVYRYLLTSIGASRLGAWSVIMAASSIARITDMGFSGGLTRFVSKYRARHDDRAVVEVIQTGAISMMLFTALALVVAYPLLTSVIPRFIPKASADARILLPYALSSLGLLTMAGAFLSSLDGILRTDLRNLIMIVGTLLYTALAIVLVGRWGMIGLGWAQLAQAAFILGMSWLALRSQVQLPWIPSRWVARRFREMVGYNAYLQLGSLASLLGDPAAKLLLGRFGDLATVGYFEMATKLVSQFRAVVVNVNQILVPVIARLKERQETGVNVLYEHTHRTIFLIAVTFFGTLLACVPLVSLLWIGEFNITFSGICLIILPSMAINTLASAAFFSNLGVGDASNNARVQVAMGILNVMLGVLLGRAVGGWGVVVAYGISIVLGSVYLMIRYQQRHGLPIKKLLPSELRTHLLLTGLLSILSLLALPHIAAHSLGAAWVTAAAGVLIMLGSAARSKVIRVAWCYIVERHGADKK